MSKPGKLFTVTLAVSCTSKQAAKRISSELAEVLDRDIQAGSVVERQIEIVEETVSDEEVFSESEPESLIGLANDEVFRRE